MRKFCIAGNWKMNTTLKEGLDLYQKINFLALDLDWELSPENSISIIVSPPFTHIYPFLEVPTRDLSLGAQNCSSEAKGAFTGEVSATMIASLNVRYVILGHSERRQYFGENSELLVKKVNLALEAGLIPIFCFGETRPERESGSFLSIIEQQVEEALFHLSAEKFSSLILAYEPVWAIGTGLTASPDQAQEVHQFIRNKIASKYSPTLAETISILYGGSVNEKNAEDLFSKADIDGGLIGGASLKPDEFIQIAKLLKDKKITTPNT